MDAPVPQPRRVPLSALSRALVAGWHLLWAHPKVSLGGTALFALIGAVLLGLVVLTGKTPMALPLAGGFMLIAPAILAGYFQMARVAQSGGTPHLSDALDGLRNAPRGLWVIALFCALLFLIWITDAATLYSFMVGREAVSLGELSGHGDALGFMLFGSVMGGALALAIFVVSAFSVPLLAEGRAGLVGAVSASVKAIFSNLPVAVLWAFLLAVATIVSTLLLPLLVIVLPWLAYSSHALYREIFPL